VSYKTSPSGSLRCYILRLPDFFTTMRLPRYGLLLVPFEMVFVLRQSDFRDRRGLCFSVNLIGPRFFANFFPPPEVPFFPKRDISSSL